MSITYKVYYIVNNKILSWERFDSENKAKIAASDFRFSWKNTSAEINTPIDTEK